MKNLINILLAVRELSAIDL